MERPWRSSHPVTRPTHPIHVHNHFRVLASTRSVFLYTATSATFTRRWSPSKNQTPKKLQNYACYEKLVLLQLLLKFKEAWSTHPVIDHFASIDVTFGFQIRLPSRSPIFPSSITLGNTLGSPIHDSIFSFKRNDNRNSYSSRPCMPLRGFKPSAINLSCRGDQVVPIANTIFYQVRRPTNVTKCVCNI